MTRNVAILVFDDVEVLDFAGPFEVFNVAREMHESRPFEVFTVAQENRPVYARGKLSINPAYTLQTSPSPDILVIPGGWGTRAQLKNAELLQWIKTKAGEVELLLSVCTGALLLAQAGLLDGVEATTHASAFDELRQIAPTAQLRADKRYVDLGRIITAGGVSAGIDIALYVVHKLLGDDVLSAVRQEMEYYREA